MEKKMNARMQELLAAIHDRFIEEVGPVGGYPDCRCYGEHGEKSLEHSL